MVADDLLARLKTVGAAAVFDTEVPDRHTVGVTPTLVLQHVSDTAETEIDGDITLNEYRWQVSVRGSRLDSVRTMAETVKTSLHGFTSTSIQRCDYESSPGTIRESSNPVEYHAPLDFTVLS